MARVHLEKEDSNFLDTGDVQYVAFPHQSLHLTISREAQECKTNRQKYPAVIWQICHTYRSFDNIRATKIIYGNRSVRKWGGLQMK